MAEIDTMSVGLKAPLTSSVACRAFGEGRRRQAARQHWQKAR